MLSNLLKIKHSYAHVQSLTLTHNNFYQHAHNVQKINSSILKQESARHVPQDKCSTISSMFANIMSHAQLTVNLIQLQWFAKKFSLPTTAVTAHHKHLFGINNFLDVLDVTELYPSIIQQSIDAHYAHRTIFTTTSQTNVDTHHAPPLKILIPTHKNVNKYQQLQLKTMINQEHHHNVQQINHTGIKTHYLVYVVNQQIHTTIQTPKIAKTVQQTLHTIQIHNHAQLNALKEQH